MLPFFGTTAILIATLAGPPALDSSDAVRAPQPAASVTTAASADAAKGAPRQQQAISTNRPAPPTEEQVIRQQLEFRVLMPPLSGDGGG
ncbi:MAG: hypothetical protein JWO85_2345 [Candidatus Eremiobacteraeota bacterium]|nr:hypothetical protein [Candidatus Eremiobacteraeota bacterium]